MTIKIFGLNFVETSTETRTVVYKLVLNFIKIGAPKVRSKLNKHTC